ncbi:hypothetical protein ACQPXH_13115 [Nocardia sp. CA-135953]|uniref:hypothetical protein n=1 Tax=Nocardia sp. CA-135953 TaxID=3239978 RepID=UPI003D98C97D
MVIMDEPTTALGVRETAAVEKLMRGLPERGITVLIISHDLAQVMRSVTTWWCRGAADPLRHIGSTGWTATGWSP